MGINTRCDIVTSAIQSSGIPCPNFFMACVMEIHTPDKPLSFIGDVDIFANLKTKDKLNVILQDFVCYAHVIFYLARIMDCDRLLPSHGNFIDLKAVGFKQNEADYIKARSLHLLEEAAAYASYTDVDFDRLKLNKQARKYYNYVRSYVACEFSSSESEPTGEREIFPDAILMTIPVQQEGCDCIHQ